MIMTSIDQIRRLNPCTRGYAKLYKLYHPKYGMKNEFPMSSLLDTHPWPDVELVLRRLGYDEIAKKVVIIMRSDLHGARFIAAFKAILDEGEV